MVVSMPRHFKRVVAVAVVGLAGLYCLTLLLNSHATLSITSKHYSRPAQDAHMTAISDFVASNVQKMVQNAPTGFDRLSNYNKTYSNDGWPENFAAEDLEQYLQVSDEEAAAIRQAHSAYVDTLPDELPNGLFKGRGIVMTGGGKYFPIMVVAIQWIRDINPDIPIEVFMADWTEYETTYCNDVFPGLNVQCRVIEEIYGYSTISKLDYKGYPLKALAILASSFKDVYLMDVDCYPMMDISKVFDSEPYKSTGYVLFPDYWNQLTSPAFYDIAGVKLGRRVRGDPHREAWQQDLEGAMHGRTVESGQMFVDKAKHFRSLLLATYYNIYGRKCFFPLISAGSPGEGDKDTFPAAAVVLGEEYYKYDKIGTLGVNKPSGWVGNAMVHYDPRETMKRRAAEEKGLTFETVPMPLSVHANIVKANPKIMLGSSSDPKELEKLRLFGALDGVKRSLTTDEDVELKLFNIIKWVTCELGVKEQYIPSDWKGEDVEVWCHKLIEHTEWLQENLGALGPA